MIGYWLPFPSLWRNRLRVASWIDHLCEWFVHYHGEVISKKPNCMSWTRVYLIYGNNADILLPVGTYWSFFISSCFDFILKILPLSFSLFVLHLVLPIKFLNAVVYHCSYIVILLKVPWHQFLPHQLSCLSESVTSLLSIPH